MLKFEDITDKNDKDDEYIHRAINGINEFFFNPDETMAFGNAFNINDLIDDIKAEERLLCYTYKSYYREYLKIEFLLNSLAENRLKYIQEDLYSTISGITIFFPNSFLTNIYDQFDDIIVDFSEKEKEILQDYKNTSRLFYTNGLNCITKYNLADEFWDIYFSKFITTQQTISLLKYNKRKYTTVLNEALLFNDKPEWIIDYASKKFDFPLSGYLKDIFNLSEKEKEILNVIFAEEQLYVANNIILASKSLFSPPIQRVCLEYALTSRMPYIYDIDGDDLARFLLKEIFKNNKIFAEEVFIRQNDYISIKLLNGANGFIQASYHSLDAQSMIKKYLPFSDNITDLNLIDFSHVEKEVASLLQVLQQEKPKDILIWGPPGFGKTQLVKVINKNLNLNIIEVNKDKVDSEARFNLITTAKNIKTLVTNYSILIDEAEDILKGKESKSILTRELDNKKVTTFWIINNLEDIPEAYLRRFDYILEISEMPFDLRKQLALKELADKSDDGLAYKIAQAIHTPAEIKSAVQWCHITNDYSWANISSKIIAYQKALSKSIKNEIGNFSIEVIAPEQNTSLDNFAGYAYIKEEAKDILDIFAHPEKYSKVGAKVPKGILLSGEPGVGKTMFTKCLASELSTTLITADSSALAKQPERIKMLFEKAKSQAPCIVFIDEIDVLASSVLDSQGNIDTEKQKILNQLLVELDGFHSFSGVMVIGATHRADLLDEAVTRSGRLGKTIYFRSPSMQDRQEIIAHYCDTIKHEQDINYHQLAKLSAAFTSADIAMAVNEAALLAARRGREYVKNSDLVESINQVFFGASLNGMPMTTKQKWRTAIHEAGHALVATKIGQTPQRVTIKPHLNFLGVVNLEENEGSYGASWTQVKQKLQVFLAGLVAEEIIFSEHSQGVESDLNMINKFVNDAINKSGMSTSLGVMTIGVFDKVSYKLMEQMEDEKRQIINEAKEIVTQWLTEHKKELVDFAKLLYEQRSLDQDTMKQWFTTNILKKDMIDENTDIESLIEAAYNA